MKSYKLLVHNKNYSVEDLVINPKDFPNLKKGDVVEIYHPEDDFSRLLLQIKVFKDDLQGKVSVEQSVASVFQLRTYNDVAVNIVDPKTVTLDSVEITFKDQYMGRSEMWRLKNSLVNTCVYLNKKIELCSGSVRCQVYEMWSGGDRVACGVISETTKVAFRSLTSMIYLFLQMSSEMWDFDIHGDLYFEKAINGFLDDLFQKWKKHGSNHEVTIVLFSRTFYKASNVEEFPQHMRECIQQDYRGRFYEDFYRVAVQNERYDDWSHILVELRRMFSDYQRNVLEYHGKPDSFQNIPKAFNSTAAQGNFLEVLNMSLNVFDMHYLDRSFDRTGQLSVVITPGVGVFHVDRELTNLTKQRVIDMGVCSDLVCLGEQPLHAVPLLKFHNKDSSLTSDDYCMPHWLNLSFYSSNKSSSFSNFIPRIKLPPRRTKPPRSKVSNSMKPRTPCEPDDSFSTTVDYNNYDAKVFSLPTAPNTKGGRAMKKTSVCALESAVKVTRRKFSDPDIHYWGSSESTSPQVHSNTSTPHHLHPDLSPSPHGSMRFYPDSPGSPKNVPNGGPLSRRAALVNPFDPSHITIKLTSNRRRWAHIFPKGSTGLLMQQHHYQASPTCFTKPSKSLNSKPNEHMKKPRPSLLPLGVLTNTTSSRRGTILLWGPTGEQEWTPSLTTGVDWKSLTIPACLPITTDYFPDVVCLHKDYLFSDYNLLPEDVNSDYANQRVVFRKPLTTLQVFQELVSQRLSQSFQIVMEETESPNVHQSSEAYKEYKLSIGRLFHKIVLSGSEIRVTRYRPRHPYPPFSFHYRYRFKAPDHENYCVSWVSFTTEKLENYSWNFLDNYICTRGDTDFPLEEKLKYWRFRVYLLPLSQAVTKKILEGTDRCDIYSPQTVEEQSNLTKTFLHFIETYVNKIKRLTNQKKPRQDFTGFNLPSQLNHRRYSTGILTQSSMMGNSPFRERLGSNRLPEKPRPRSGSKVLEKGRVSPATDFSLVQLSNNDHDQEDQEVGTSFMLKETASFSEVAEGLKHTSHGLTFLSQHPSLPTNTFVSADALNWLLSHMEGSPTYEQAFSILSGMLNEKIICHASGDFSQKFVVGFYLYYFVKTKDDTKDFIEPCGDLTGFQNEWAEVEVEQAKGSVDAPLFLSEVLPPHCPQAQRKGPMYKESHLETDVQSKSDRVEWGHARYHASYSPNCAYEMVVKWEASSGAIVADLILGWARKAQTCSLQMIPVPADPFALPYSQQSDPLRGPVFIPLDIEALMGTKSYLFQEFEEESWPHRLSLLQESIALRFGFISSPVDSNQHQHKQYIHLSGNVFLLVPSVRCEHNNGGGIGTGRPRRSYILSQEAVTTSPHHEYITRHVTSHTSHSADNRVGFLWCWNHMVSKKWRLGINNATCDEGFQNKLLKDFKQFCSNNDNRLKCFWDQCCDKKQVTKQSN